MQQAPGTKVIVVSGTTDTGSAKKVVENGAFEFYPKPVDIQQLGELIERAYNAYK